MKGSALALVVGLVPFWASANPVCQERCAQSLGRCGGSCSADQKCQKRCGDQFEGCIQRCNKEKVQVDRLPAKCIGPRGRSVPCSSLQAPPPNLRVPKEELNPPEQKQPPAKQ